MKKPNENDNRTYVTPAVEEVQLITAPTLTGVISNMGEEEG